VTFSPVCLDII